MVANRWPQPELIQDGLAFKSIVFYACPRAHRGVRPERCKQPSSNRTLLPTQADSRGQFMLSGMNTRALPGVFSPERLRRPRIAVSRQVAAPGPRFLPQTHAQALAASRQVNPPLTSFPASSHTERPTLLPVSSKSTIISEATTHRRPGINNGRVPLHRAVRPNATGVQSPESRSPDCERSRTLRSAPALPAPRLPGAFLFSIYTGLRSGSSEKGGVSWRNELPFGSGSPCLSASPRSLRTPLPVSVGRTERGGWVGAGGERGPAKPSAKAFRVTHGTVRVGLLLASWLRSPPNTRRGQTFTSKEEQENLTPASRRVSPVQRAIPAEADSEDPALGWRPPQQ